MHVRMHTSSNHSDEGLEMASHNYRHVKHYSLRAIQFVQFRQMDITNRGKLCFKYTQNEIWFKLAHIKIIKEDKRRMKRLDDIK